MYLSEPILVVTRQKKGGGAIHWGVRFPDGRVADHSQDVGLRITDDDGFADGFDVTIVRAVPVELTATVYERMREVLRSPRKYHVLEWNCETFAEWLTAGVPESAQVTNAVTVVLLGFVAVAFAAG